MDSVWSAMGNLHVWTKNLVETRFQVGSMSGWTATTNESTGHQVPGQDALYKCSQLVSRRFQTLFVWGRPHFVCPWHSVHPITAAWAHVRHLCCHICLWHLWTVKQFEHFYNCAVWTWLTYSPSGVQGNQGKQKWKVSQSLFFNIYNNYNLQSISPTLKVILKWATLLLMF